MLRFYQIFPLRSRRGFEKFAERPHQALERNSPTPRDIEAPEKGKVIAILQECMKRKKDGIFDRDNGQEPFSTFWGRNGRFADSQLGFEDDERIRLRLRSVGGRVEFAEQHLHSLSTDLARRLRYAR